jgi:hypothetical protein
MKRHEIYFCGSGDVSLAVYRPESSHGVVNITIETDEERIELNDVHFDVAESLRDALDKVLDEMTEGGATSVETMNQEKSIEEQLEEQAERFSELERADGKLGKAAWAWLGALSAYEETTDVDELYRCTRGYIPDITISKSLIRVWTERDRIGRDWAEVQAWAAARRKPDESRPGTD